MKQTLVGTPAISVTTSPQSLCICWPGGVSKRTVARPWRNARLGWMYRRNMVTPPL